MHGQAHESRGRQDRGPDNDGNSLFFTRLQANGNWTNIQQLTTSPDIQTGAGFGYDPLFFVAEAHKTFAEMGAEEKAKYSHRGAAFREFLAWLKPEIIEKR